MGPFRKRLAATGLLLTIAVGSGLAVTGGSATATTTPDAPGGEYVPLSQGLVVDTNTDLGLVTVNEQPRSFQVGGSAGVPTTDVEAVVVNTIVTNATERGGLRFGPTVEELSGNGFFHSYEPGDATSNQSILRLSDTGKVAIAASAGGVDVVIRIVGYFTESGSGAGLHAVSPVRLLDTHIGTGGRSTPLQPGQSVTVTLPDWVPTTSNAAWVNVTAFGANGNGWLGLKPVGATYQGTRASYDSGAPRSTGVITRTDDRSFAIINNGDFAVDVTLDWQGYFLPGGEGGAFFPRVATLIDTHLTDTGGPLAPGEAITLWPLGSNGLPAYNISALSLNVTVFYTSAPGTLRVWPAGKDEPSIATMHFDAQERTTNSVLVGVGLEDATGGIEIRNDSSVTVDIGVNTEGWFSAWDDSEDEVNSVQPFLDVAHACMVTNGEVAPTTTTAETLGTVTDAGTELPPTTAGVTPSTECINTAITEATTVIEETGSDTQAVAEDALEDLSVTANSTPEQFPPTNEPSLVTEDDLSFTDAGDPDGADDTGDTDRWFEDPDLMAKELSPPSGGCDGSPTYAQRFKKLNARQNKTSMDTFIARRYSPCYFIWTTDECSAPDPLRNTKWNFKWACTRHDFGYRNLKYLERYFGHNPWRRFTKAAVDTRFGWDMRNRCRTFDYYALPLDKRFETEKKDRRVCRRFAKIYEGAVRYVVKPRTVDMKVWSFYGRVDRGGTSPGPQQVTAG